VAIAPSVTPEARALLAPKQNLLDLTGIVVDSFREVQELAQFHVAFIDRGSKDGVQVGNRLFVMRRGDGRLELEDDAVEKLPWEQVGELLVVETHDRNSTVLVTRSAKELKVGDRVLFAKYAGTEIKLDGKKLLIMKESDILGVIA